jgi:hypothetical protein
MTRRGANGHAVGRAAHVVQPELEAELDRIRIAALLAANADFRFLRVARPFDRHLDQLADALLVDRLERIGRQEFLGPGIRPGTRRCRRG